MARGPVPEQVFRRARLRTCGGFFFVAIHGWHYALEDEEVRKCFIVLGEPLLELMKARYNRGDLLSTSFERGLYRAEAIEMGREWPGWVPPARSGMKIALA